MNPQLPLSGFRTVRFLPLFSIAAALCCLLTGCDARQTGNLNQDPNVAISVNDRSLASRKSDSSMSDGAASTVPSGPNESSELLEQEPATQETDPKDSRSLLGKASDLFNKAKEKGAESAKNATGWVQEKYNGTAGATSDAADGAMKWANDTFESLKAKGMTTANSTSEWLSSDWKNMESWEYKVVSNPPTEATELESQLNQLGADGWECIDIRDNRLVFKKQRESYLRRLPFKDLLKLAPLMNMGEK